MDFPRRRCRRLTHQTCRPCGETHPSLKGASMEWSRYQVIKKKRKKKNPLHLHLAGRCDLFWKTPPLPFPCSEKKESRTICLCKVCFSATYRKYCTYRTLRRNWRETSFCTFGQTLLFFFLSHDVSLKNSFEGSERFPRRWSNNGEIQTIGRSIL